MNPNFETIRAELKDVLKNAYKDNNLQLIETKTKTFSKTETDTKSPLDQAFRDAVLELLEQDADVSELQTVVSFCIQACRKGMCTATMPVVLLGDVFDLLTLDVCEEMFTFVEQEVDVWKEELFFISCKNNLLRMCNDLLRRLSRSSATVFCGRILLFLAKFFPFSERSGLNIVSEFNLENVTEYGADAEENVSTEHDVGDPKKNIVIDYSLYCKFWSLQDFFRNPNQCYNKVQWKLFCSHAASILNVFQGLKLEHVDKDNQLADNSDSLYFSKYLTNQKLLDLQIYDANFRRNVLLQFLILFQYLTSPVKFKMEVFELKGDQKEWVQTMTEKVYSLIRETPPDGDKFAAITKNILGREEQWNVWKNEGCPEFKKQLPTSDAEKLRRNVSERPKLGDIIKEAHKAGKHYMGSPELTKLWNLSPDNLEACKAKDRDFLPSLDSYFSDAIEQFEAPAPIKDEDNLFKDGNFGWRALRLLARRSPYFFTYSNNPINQLPDYLEMMVQKIAADRPGRVQEVPEQNDAELEENLFKAADEEPAADEKPGEGEEFADEANARAVATSVTMSQLQLFASKIADDWKRLASKLGFKPDEVNFFAENNPTEEERGKNMLHVWFEDDEDATLENFLYILEGLDMSEAAEAVREELNSVET